MTQRNAVTVQRGLSSGRSRRGGWAARAPGPCHHGLGRLYAPTGQRQQARAALSTATEMYRAMAMTLWLPQAEAALAQIGEAEKTAGGVPEA